jgi:putative ABC transport system ATP-binding protein
MYVIEMGGITKDYRLGNGSVSRVLKSVDLSVESGEFVAIMGPSGSGKSTLMNLLGTLDRPTSGSYLLDEEDTSILNDVELAKLRNSTIGFVFQGFNLLPRRTLLDNVALPLFYGGETHKERTKRASHYLGQMGLSEHLDYFPTHISGGQQQRVAIARALAGEPKLLLADEPTGNLDSQTSDEIMKLFKSLNKEGITIVLVTHEHDVARYADRLVHVKDGEVIYDGVMY